jgi:hypothetical protein
MVHPYRDMIERARYELRILIKFQSSLLFDPTTVDGHIIDVDCDSFVLCIPVCLVCLFGFTTNINPLVFVTFVTTFLLLALLYIQIESLRSCIP